MGHAQQQQSQQQQPWQQLTQAEEVAAEDEDEVAAADEDGGEDDRLFGFATPTGCQSACITRRRRWARLGCFQAKVVAEAGAGAEAGQTGWG